MNHDGLEVRQQILGLSIESRMEAREAFAVRVASVSALRYVGETYVLVHAVVRMRQARGHPKCRLFSLPGAPGKNLPIRQRFVTLLKKIFFPIFD